MKLLILIALCFSFTACGVFKPLTTGVSGSNEKDAELAPYYNQFMAIAAQNNYPVNHPSFLSITFVSGYNEAGKVGQCHLSRYSDGTVVAAVTFVRGFWNYLNETEKKSLTYHEFAHCILYRGHTTESIEINGFYMPKSLMYPTMINGTYNSIFGAEFMTRNFTYFENELFNPAYAFNPVRKVEENTKTVEVFSTNQSEACDDHVHTEELETVSNQ